MNPAHRDSEIVHASCVAVGRKAVLFLGESGTGKSALALDLTAMGAVLVADDRTILTRRDESIYASCPPAIQGKIEARGVGLLTAETIADVRVALVVDLDKTEQDRLPTERTTSLLGCEIRLLYQVPQKHFSAAVHLVLKTVRIAQ